MTGRDLIIYILQNRLEEEQVFSDHGFLDFMTVEEVAAKFDVGSETIKLWYAMKFISGVELCGSLFFPRDIKDPRGKE